MRQPENKIVPLCKELVVIRQILYRHVCPKGSIRPGDEGRTWAENLKKSFFWRRQ
jgi:hypothetical protein